MARVRFPYRSTENGGFDYVYVFEEDGTLKEPEMKEHGEGIYELVSGVYYVVHFSRDPNKPITVRYRKMYLSHYGIFYVQAFEDINEDDLPQAVKEKIRAIYNKLAGGEEP